MSIKINKETCIGCGACVAIAGDVFTMGADGKSEVISQENLESAKQAAGACPVQAITV